MSDLGPRQAARDELTSKIVDLVLDALHRGGFEVLKSEDLDRSDAEMRRLQDENAILRAEVERLTGRLADLESRR